MGPLIGPNKIFAKSKIWNFHFPSISEIWVILEEECLIKTHLNDLKLISEIFIAYSHNSAYFLRILASKFPELPNSNYAFNLRLTSLRFSAHSLINGTGYDVLYRP